MISTKFIKQFLNIFNKKNKIIAGKTLHTGRERKRDKAPPSGRIVAHRDFHKTAQRAVAHVGFVVHKYLKKLLIDCFFLIFF